MSPQVSQVPGSQRPFFFSCQNVFYGLKCLFGWSGSTWAIQGSHWGPDDAHQHRGQSLGSSVSSAGSWHPLRTYSACVKGYKWDLEIWGVIIMSQTILWCLNFLKYLGIQHSQDSCLKESLLKQDHIQCRLLGLVGSGIAEKPSWFKKCVPRFWAFWSIYCFLMACVATNCIVFFPRVSSPKMFKNQAIY